MSHRHFYTSLYCVFTLSSFFTAHFLLMGNMFYTLQILLQLHPGFSQVKTASTSHRLLDFPQMHPHLRDSRKASGD